MKQVKPHQASVVTLSLSGVNYHMDQARTWLSQGPWGSMCTLTFVKGYLNTGPAVTLQCGQGVGMRAPAAAMLGMDGFPTVLQPGRLAFTCQRKRPGTDTQLPVEEAGSRWNGEGEGQGHVAAPAVSSKHLFCLLPTCYCKS